MNMDSAVTTIQAVVRAVDGNEAVVEVAQGGCGRCHENGGCGGQNLTQMLCAGEKKTYRVDNAGGAHVGDQVTVAITVGAVTRSANLAYAIPLAGLLGGAVIGMQVGGDPGAISGGAVGLLLAWLFARFRASADSERNAIRPYIVARS